MTHACMFDDSLDMRRIVGRLRTSKAELIAEKEECGLSHGRRWAANVARFSQLTLLEGLYGELNVFADHPDYQTVKDIYCDRFEASWEELFGAEDAYISPAQLKGWLDGAMEIWNGVKAKI